MKKLRLHNRSLLFQWLWYSAEKEELWKELVKEKYDVDRQLDRKLDMLVMVAVCNRVGTYDEFSEVIN